jgi:hypothetical protein
MTLTVGDLRKHVTTNLVDPALQKLLDAAYAAIANRVGSAGAVTEFADGGYPTLILDRQAASITSVTETVGGTAIVLAANDYRVSGYVLTRLNTGTNPRTIWGPTETLYVPPVDDAESDRVAIGLVRLDLTHNPGLTAEKIGDWEETYADNSAMNYGLEREVLLGSLVADSPMRVVGG